MGDYVQDDDYSCAALAINRFAEELRNLSNGTVLGGGIDEFLKFKKTSDENIENAKSLFIRLVETQFDCFKLMDDLGHNWEKQREESDESDNEPPPAEKFDIDKNNQRKEETDENNQLLPEGSNEINPVVEEKKRESNPMDNGKTVETNQVADQATEGCQDDSRQLRKRSERNDKTGKPPKKKKECPPSEDKSVAETKCNSGEMCLLPEKNYGWRVENAMDLDAPNVGAHFTMSVCSNMMESCIAQNASNKMWCHSVPQRHCSKTCSTMMTGQHQQKACLPTVARSSAFTLTTS